MFYKFILPLLMLSIALSACAQEPSIDKFYEKYKSQDALQGELTINPTDWLTGAIGKNDNDKWSKKITSIRLLILDGKKSPGLQEDVARLSNDLHGDRYEDMVTVTKGSQERIEVMAKDLSGDSKDLVFLIKGKDGGFVLVQLKGHFTQGDLADIRSSIHDNDNVQVN